MIKIVFVCTGNTCRSPMAQAILTHTCKGDEVSADSCGIYATDGDKLSAGAKDVLCRNGIDFDHVSKRASLDTLSDADYIVGITSTHAQELCIAYPALASKIYSFPIDVQDPFGGDAAVYDKCYEEIAKGIESIKKVILKNEK